MHQILTSHCAMTCRIIHGTGHGSVAPVFTMQRRMDEIKRLVSLTWEHRA